MVLAKPRTARLEAVKAAYLSGKLVDTIAQEFSLSPETIKEDIAIIKAELRSKSPDLELIRNELWERVDRQVDEIVQEMNHPSCPPIVRAKYRGMLLNLYIKLIEKLYPSVIEERKVEAKVVWEGELKPREAK